MDLNAFSSMESKEVFKWFNEINKIPRESGHEKEISDFLVKFAKDRNLEVENQDMKKRLVIFWLNLLKIGIWKYIKIVL